MAFTYSIRPATANDFAQIRALVRAERLNPLGLNWPRFWVATSPGGEVLACGQVKLHRDGSRELASIVVRPDWRGRGVARTLIASLIGSHPGTLYLTCRASLESFYAQFGFQVIEKGEMPPYFRRVYGLFRLFKRFNLIEGELLVMCMLA